MTQRVLTATPGRAARSAIALVLSSVVIASAAPAVGLVGANSQTRTTTGHLDPGLSITGSALARVIVTATNHTVTSAAAAMRAVRGSVTQPLPIVGGVAGTVDPTALRRLAADGAVLAVTADRQVKLSDLVYDDGATLSTFVKATGATTAWSEGNLGSGVGVAVLDTGTSDMKDLAGRVVHGPDLSGEGSTIDSYGHGTVMAGIIAGSGVDSWKNKGAYTGIAPKATIVPVKVAGRNGSVDVSTMLQAMHWVAAYRDQFNIRVLNVSWGVPSTQDPSVDPLNYAVEQLWQLGIVVVVAAGNTGPAGGTILKPGDDPLVMTVGAYDDHGTTAASDDTVPLWSSRGPTAAGSAKPDVVAPGRLLVATRSFASAIEQSYPRALIGPSYIRGSGTSQATAVVSGLVALLLAQRPELTPDQVKYLFKATAVPILGAAITEQGAGRAQLPAALSASVALSPVQVGVATGLGSLELSRGGLHVSTTCGLLPAVIGGEIDVHCEPWDPAAWTGTTWTGDSWTGTTWEAQAWTPARWTGTTWTGGIWAGGSWLGTAWTGTTWTGTTWTGTTWTGTTWTGTTWTGTTWTGTTWTGGAGVLPLVSNEFQTAFWGDEAPVWATIPGEKSAAPSVVPPQARLPWFLL